MALPAYFLQELKQRSSIEEVVSRYVNLKRRGKNVIGLCPFHNEKTPSFTLYPENGSFYCFGCSVGGDVITFIMRMENLDYIEAVRLLAERAGMQMPEDGYDDSLGRLKTRVLEINRETARFFHKQLMTSAGAAGRSYLTARGMDQGTIRRFGLGYAPDSGFALVNHLRGKGYDPQELVQANVAGQSKKGHAYDRFRGRVMFPIIDLRGNVVAFGGRILTDEKPKYINTADTPVYHKSDGLFAMNFAKDSGTRQLILAEGYMDVISLHRAGFANAIASLGTSLTEGQARVIKRYADEVVICYDADEAGQRAAQRAIPILKGAGLFVKVLTVPGNKDPDEFMRAHGAQGPARFRALLDGCRSDTEYRLHQLKAGFDVTTEEGRIRFLKKAADVLGELEDPVSLDVYAGKLSTEMDVDRSAIVKLAQNAQEKKVKQKKKATLRAQNEVLAAKTMVNDEKRENLRVANAEEGLLAYLFANQDMVGEVRKALPPEKLQTSFGRRVYGLILGKNKDGEFSITDFSQDLSRDEMSELTRILVTHQNALPSKKDVTAYIQVILRETGYQSRETIKNASPEDLKGYLEMLKKQKSRGNE